MFGIARLGVACALWFLLSVAFLPFMRTSAPAWLARTMSWGTFVTTTQVLTPLVGVGLVFLLAPEPRDALAWRLTTKRALLRTTLIAPITFVLATMLGIAIAMPTLLAELEARGAGVSRANAGAFGAELQTASLWTTIVRAAGVATISEELLFRGAIWSFIDRIARPLAPKELTGEEAELRGDGTGRRLMRVLCRGTIATLVSALIFGWAHHDLPGGVGIVRVVSTTILGLAAGSARQLSGSILAAILLHTVHNLLSLAQARGVFGAAAGTTMGAPNVVIALSTLSAIAVLVLVVLDRRAPKSSTA